MDSDALQIGLLLYIIADNESGVMLKLLFYIIAFVWIVLASVS